MGTSVSAGAAERQSEKRPLRNSPARYDDGGDIGQEHAGCKVKRARTQANAALYKALRRAPEGWPTAHDYVAELLGDCDADDEDRARATQEDYADRLNVSLGTIKRCHRWALGLGLIEVVDVVRMPRGRLAGYAGNVIKVNRDAIAALSPDVKVPPRPARQFITHEDLARIRAEADRRIAEVEAKAERQRAEAHAASDRRIAELAARAAQQRAEDRAAAEARDAEHARELAAVRAMFAAMTSAPPAPVVDAPAATCGTVEAPHPPSAPEPSTEAAPAVRDATAESRLRSTTLTIGVANGRSIRDPYDGATHGGGMGSPVDPPSSSQGLSLSLPSRLSKIPHTLSPDARATAIPPTPARGVSVKLLVRRADEILRHWLKTLHGPIPWDRAELPPWERTDLENDERRAPILQLLRARPELTNQDCFDANEGGILYLAPTTFPAARNLRTIYSPTHFDVCWATGRDKRLLRERERDLRERERGREREQNEIQETAAAVVPLPVHEFEAVMRKLAGGRSA